MSRLEDAVTGVLLCAVGYCVAVYVVMPALRWLQATLEARAESVAEEFDTQPRNSFDAAVDESVLLTHEVADEEPNATAADILLWEAEVQELPAVNKYMRRMDRWSQ